MPSVTIGGKCVIGNGTLISAGANDPQVKIEKIAQ